MSDSTATVDPLLWRAFGRRARPDYSCIPAPASDPLARRDYSRSASSSDYQCACVGLTGEKPRWASVSNALRRHSWIIPA